MASRVEFDPAPAMTGTLPRAVSTHSSTTRMCSLWLRVGRLAGGADRNQPVGSLRDLPFDQPREGRLVDLAVLERRNEGGDGTLETLNC